MSYQKGKEIGKAAGEAVGSGAGVAFGFVGGVHKGLSDRFGAGKVLAVCLLAFWLVVVFYVPQQTTAPPLLMEAAQSVQNVQAVQSVQSVSIYDESGPDVPYKALFIREGKRVDVPWKLLAAIAKYESAFVPTAISTDGYASRGLGQFLYTTWTPLAKAYGYTWAQALEAEPNIVLMADHANWLRKTVARAGMTEREIVKRLTAGWNWGAGNVNKYGPDAAPARTRTYVANILTYAGY